MAGRKRGARRTVHRRALETPTVCGTCVRIIDREAVREAQDKGVEYKHPCGKVLVAGR